MSRYLLDTNTVGHLFRKHPGVLQRLQQVPISALCISAITEGEIRFGLARRPGAKRLHDAANKFLQRVDVLGWDSSAANDYGALRARLEAAGLKLGALDTLIAAQALASHCILVSSDRAFARVAGLSLEDWTN